MRIVKFRNFRNLMMSDKAELEGGKRLAEDEAAGGSDRETRKKSKVREL